MPPPSGSLTPMLRHYLEIKAQHPDALLLYRMGDFYELFFEDARTAAPLLEITLTARQKGTANEAPMCGIPHHALESYVGKLLRAGLKVAICDQMEDPAAAKGLVRREVTRVMTPGTVSEPVLLDGNEDNLLASLGWQDGAGAGAFLDVSTASFFVRRWRGPEEAIEDLELLRPREVLFAEGTLPEAVAAWLQRQGVCETQLAPEQTPRGARAEELLARQLGLATLRGLGLEAGEPAVAAAAAALLYAQDTQKSGLSHLRTLAVRDSSDSLVLDATTLANLEVLRSLREGGRRGTLLSIVDRTLTPAGGRMLRDWLRRPLRDPQAIAERHDAVAELLEQAARRERLRQTLSGVGDPERLASRAVLGTLGPREAGALRESLRRAPEALAETAGCAAGRLQELAASDPLAGLLATLEATLVEAPPHALRDGGVIAEGLDPELDAARSLAQDSKRHILALEARERQRTGIGSLKVRYNKVFGYYVEVTKANQHLVPDDYVRKQTLVNAERYVTPEIKELEEAILAAEERQLALEQAHYERLLAAVAERAPELRRLGEALAELDVLATFAEVAARQRWCRPTVLPAGAGVRIEEGRHPVVEALSRDPFVPNDAELDPGERQVVVLTGPNMGGKSTYLRQVALIVLLAQAGSFVPAATARVGAVDRIFTRVGASDDLARGESTFMVEMIETARILHHATAESLVVLDEVGRGTATFDGLSLAWAIVEHLHERCGAMTLFATHYHELTELAQMLPRVVNRTMAVKEWEEKILFLRRVVPGSADKSYGLQVARLAGLPQEVVTRAGEVLRNLEAQEYDPAGRPRLARGDAAPPAGHSQLRLFSAGEEAVARRLRDADLDRLTPLEALNLLQQLKDELGSDQKGMSSSSAPPPPVDASGS
ncbi:MAG TPA: DNA mismatch repair protein MutS [Thermoanaerobaculia bacterium]|nr:DNA mismatch repair protein MutS [Thermoanaerobaculia bacterium]